MLWVFFLTLKKQKTFYICSKFLLWIFFFLFCQQIFLCCRGGSLGFSWHRQTVERGVEPLTLSFRDQKSSTSRSRTPDVGQFVVTLCELNQPHVCKTGGRSRSSVAHFLQRFSYSKKHHVWSKNAKNFLYFIINWIFLSFRLLVGKNETFEDLIFGHFYRPKLWLMQKISIGVITINK